jgi:PTH1 family peptidyl-tRNA hydrolase
MKYLIAGLGNIGSEYEGTRHNIGFDVVEDLAREAGVTFQLESQAMVARIKHKGRNLILIKPTTYMNLSGRRCDIGCRRKIWNLKIC